MDLFHEHPFLNFNHKSNLEKNKRRKLNRHINSLFNSSKIRMCNTLFNRFRVFLYENHDKSVRMNQDARLNKGCHIQRIEYLKCNILFDELKNSIIIQEQTFMTSFNKVIEMTAGYNVKGYLTWSSSHKTHPPSITT